MNCPGVEYVETSKSKPAVIYDGYKYRIKKRNKTSINWECVNANFCGCKGRLTTTVEGNVSVTCAHGCTPGTGEALDDFFPVTKKGDEVKPEEDKPTKRRTRKRKMKNGGPVKIEDNITPEPSDINDEDQYSGSIMKDAEKLKLMLLAWNYHTQSQGRNGDQVDSTAARLAAVANSDNMADLWASYHSALGLAGGKSSSAAKTQPSTPPVTAVRDQSSPILASGGASAMDTSGHDETSSSAGGTAKDDDDGMLGDDDDDSDDRVDPQHHDPERLKAFNMFVRLFVDENLDRIVPISKQPKEKIQAIIDSCTRQFPEFAERSRKRIRTYLKSCRRNKKVRGEAGGTPVSGTGSCPVGSAAWEAAMQTRPTPAHLTSIQAEQILAQACENESHNAKRMRLGLEPVSQALPTIPGNMITDTTASSATHPHPLLSLYSSTTSTNMHNPGSSPSPSGKLGDHTTNSIGTSMENGIGLLNNNSIIKGQNDGGGGSKTSSPASSPVPLPIFRQNYSQGFGTQSFGRQSHANATTSSVSTSSHSTSTNHQLNNHRVDSTSTTNALLSTLRVIGGASSTGVNAAAVAAYQNALFSAMTAGGHAGGLAGFAGLGTAGLPTLTGTIPTDLSMKNASTSTSSLASSLHLNNSLGSLPQGTSLNHLGTGTLANPFTSSAQSSTASTKPLLLPHKLSNAEIAAVRQLITGYRESAAFLLRSADELESLLMQQP